MKQTVIAVAIVILLLVAWLSWFKCNPSPLPAQKVNVDTALINKYKRDTANYNLEIALLYRESSYETDRADALQSIVNTDEARLSNRATTITGLISKVKGYEATRDTTALLDIIDSLTDEVEQGIAAVRSYEIQNHLLDSAYKAVISIDSSQKAILIQMASECNNLAFKLQLDVQRLQNDSAVLSNSLVKSKKTAKISILVNALLAAILILKK